MIAPDWPCPPTDGDFAGRFARLADLLLNRVELVVGDVPHRLVEIEAFYHGPGHPDPFAHRDPRQVRPDLWYFHRTGGTLRGGSFKGLDLTFGSENVFAGILFRGLECPDSHIVDGPSLLVDYLVRTAGFDALTPFEAAVADRAASDSENLLRLREADDLVRPVFSTARVGLTLRRHPEAAVPWLAARYRYLTRPRATKKGRVQMITAAHADGASITEIARRLGSTLPAVARIVAAFEEGKRLPGAGSFVGRLLGSTDLARLLGHVTSGHRAS